jgi:hypothetical protein
VAGEADCGVVVGDLDPLVRGVDAGVRVVDATGGDGRDAEPLAEEVHRAAAGRGWGDGWLPSGESARRRDRRRHDRGVGRRLGRVEAADLLLPLEDEPGLQGQLADRLPVPLDGEDAGDELPLVVGGAAGDEGAAPDLGRVRVRFPELERLGRLDVVVVVDHQRPRPAPDLAVDDRGAAGGVDDAGLDAAAAQQVGRRRRGLGDADSLAGKGRLAEERSQLLQVGVVVGLDPGVEAVYGGACSLVGERRTIGQG